MRLVSAESVDAGAMREPSVASCSGEERCE